jgi:phage terminase large subunit
MSEALEITLETPNVFLPLYEKRRTKVLYGGRGGAKSWAIADALLVKAWESPILILCTRELQRSIKESVHKLLSDRIEANGFSSEFEILNNEIRGKNGSRIIFAGLKHNITEIKSTEGVDICWVEEAEKVTDASWKTLIPTIRKEDSEIWISFNPNLITDATYQRFVLNPPPDAWVQKVSWRDNPWFPEVLKREMEYLKSRDYEEYLHIWEGELKTFADGAIYRKQLEAAKKDGRICSVPIENGVEVHTFWDLGRDDDTAIWFMQQVGREFHFVDYYAARFEDIDHYARVIKSKGYLYGSHWMPHDVRAQVLGMKSDRKTMFENAGVRPIEVVERVPDLMDGIAMTKQVFDTCWFDEKRCDEGLKALANYSRAYDDERDTYSERPVHNWASNGADAFRQFAQGYKSKTVANVKAFDPNAFASNSGWMR